MELLAKLRDDGCAIVAATHDSDLVDGLADRTVTMKGAVPLKGAAAPKGAVPHARTGQA